MSKNRPTCPIHTPNENRSKAKFKRGKGIIAIRKSNLTEIEWCQKHDKLFKIKSKKRLSINYS